MRSYKWVAIITLISAITISCKKSFLQVEDQSVVLRQQYIKDLKTLGDFMNGIYINLTQSLFDGRNQIYPEVIADNIKPKTGGNQLIKEYKWTQLADVSGFSAYQYQIVKSCNFVLEKIPEFRSENPVKADDLKAQALFARALVNFVMVNIYAQSYNFTADASHPGIALPLSSNPLEAVTKRNTVAEVYASIINDLNTSIPLFSSDNISSTLLINKIAARALLARVLLFKGDYSAAKDLARAVIGKVPIMTTPEYPSKLFTLNEKEALFQLAPSSTTVMPGSFNTNFQNRYFQGTTGQIQFYSTVDLATILTQDPLDVRKSWVTLTSGNWKITKYPLDVIPGFNPTTQSYYQTILRSSEMYLIAAEAYAKINKEDSARYYLDGIRQRANSTAPATVATGSALLDAIYMERRKELAFEGLRMFDLLRWKSGVNRGTDVTNSATRNLSYPSNMAIAPSPPVYN